MPARRHRHGHPRAAHVVRAANVAVESLETRWLLSDYVVNTPADETDANSTLSLREAITLAEGTAGDDRITFDPITFPHSNDVPLTTTIVLNTPIDFTAPTPGKITIDAINNGSVTISGATSHRIFTLDSDADIVLVRMILTEGFDSQLGGAIVNDGTLVLESVQVQGNKVQGDPGSGPSGPGGDALGGGIANTEIGSLTITNSFIRDNDVIGGNGNASAGAIAGGRGGNAGGGGIYNLGELVISDSFITSNQVTSGTGGGGGASGIGGNAGIALGGGIYSTGTGATLDMTDSALLGNFMFAGDGGEVDSAHAGGIGGNASGGALFSAALATIHNTRFESSVAAAGDGTGVGAFAAAAGEAFGGAIVNAGEMSIFSDDVEIGVVSNQAFGGSSGNIGGGANGGALYNVGELTLDGVTFASNFAVGGGAAKIGGNARGGALAGEGPFDIVNSVLHFNSAQGGVGATLGSGEARGGGIHATGEIHIAFSTIAGNQATGGGGNADSGVGGGNALGGGLFISGSLDHTITTSTISDNLARGGQGASSSVFDGADGGAAFGGGIYLASPLEITNSTIYGNEARGGNGGSGAAVGGDGGFGGHGAVRMDNTVFTAINVTIASNRGVKGSGGIGGTTNGTDGQSRVGALSASDIITLTNTIIADNTADIAPNLEGGMTLHNSLVSTPPGSDYSELPGSSGNLLGVAADLELLEENGGPTETARPKRTSAAVDAGDNAAAIAEFGANGTDQRGVGFTRFADTVDIGAVELQPSKVVVRGNNLVINNGDTTPRAADFTNFGTAAQGAAAIQRTFVIKNEGEKDLELNSVTLPSGYTQIGVIDNLLAPGETTNLVIRLSTATAGTFAGNVVIQTDDNTPPADTQFKFRITGTITPIASPGNVIHINFQPAGRPIPATYLADTGAVFGNRGNGQSYGWDQSASSFTRDRNIDGDQRKDTLVHTQLFGSRTWEIQVPNGTYQVHLVAGDPQYFDSVYKINVEGVLTINATPSSGTRFFEATRNVVVTDGRLSISNASGAVNNKLDYVDIKRVIAVNFQPSGRPIPAGFLADTGSTFGSRGNGFSFGWNSSASSFTRDRDVLSDQKLDTLVHTQLFGVRTWDLGVINGTYTVKIVAGDPKYFDSVYKFNVEGQLAVNGTPTSGNRFITGTKTVTVSDGKLTITNASGSVNNKLAFIEVTPV